VKYLGHVISSEERREKYARLKRRGKRIYDPAFLRKA